MLWKIQIGLFHLLHSSLLHLPSTAKAPKKDPKSIVAAKTRARQFEHRSHAKDPQARQRQAMEVTKKRRSRRVVANDHESIRVQCHSMIWYLFLVSKRCSDNYDPQPWDPGGSVHKTIGYNLSGRCTLVVAFWSNNASKGGFGYWGCLLKEKEADYFEQLLGCRGRWTMGFVREIRR